MTMKTASALLMAGIATSLALAGCGKSVPAAVASTHLPARAPLQGPSTAPGYVAPGGAQPGAGLPGAQAPGNVQQILAAVHQAQVTQRGFTGTVDTYEKSDKGVENETLEVAYKRPNTLKLHIVKATGQGNGCKVLWDGSNDMKVKPTFMPFAVGVSISDSRVVSGNGWTIKETDVSCILGVLLDPGAQVKSLGAQTISGKAVQLLEVHSPKSPHGVTVEQIGIDTSLNLPVVRMMFKGQTLAYKLVCKTFNLGVPTEDQLSI